jgi:hypothetical protein
MSLINSSLFADHFFFDMSFNYVYGVEIIERRMVGWLVNDELKRIRKETVT